MMMGEEAIPGELKSTRPTCSKCHKSYSIGTSTNRLPMLLACGHDLCRGCVVALAGSATQRAYHGISCPTCCGTTPLPDGDESIELLPSDFYVMGIIATRNEKARHSSSSARPNDLALRKWYGPGGFSIRVADIDNVFEKLATVTSVLTPTSSVGKKLTDPCIECCQESSTVSCDVCDAVYCDACFDTIHERFSVLRSRHRRLPKEAKGLKKLTCPAHPGSKLEFFCCTDKTCVCLQCVTNKANAAGPGPHFGHDFTKFEKQLGTMKETIAEEKPHLDAHLKCLNAANIESDCLLKKMKEEGLKAMEDLHQTFIQLHRTLQIREEQLLQEAHDTLNSQVTSLLQSRHSLKCDLAECQEARKVCNAASTSMDPSTVLSAHEMLRRQVGGKTTLELQINTSAKPLGFGIDEDIQHWLCSVGHVTGSTDSRADLVRVSVESAKAMLPSKRESAIASLSGTKKNGLDYQPSSCDPSSSKSDIQVAPVDRDSMDVFPPTLSTLTNGSSQREDAHHMATSTAQEECGLSPSYVDNSSNSPKPSPSLSATDLTTASPVPSLGELPSKRSDKKPIANQTLRGALLGHFNRIPTATPAVDLLHSSQHSVKVVMPQPGQDPELATAHGHQDTTIVSSASLPKSTPAGLVSTTADSLVAPASSSAPPSATAGASAAGGNPAPKMGDGEVTVLSVTSPDEIVVRYVEDNAQLATMQKELLRHGTGSSAIRLYSVKTGDKVCVYDAGKYWYRAIVKAALDSSYTSSALPPSTPGLDVFVELLDYGSTLWVAKEKIWNLPVAFQRQPRLAYHCGLCDIIPKKSKRHVGAWPAAAVNELQRMVAGKRMMLKVVRQEGSKCLVDLCGTDKNTVPSAADALVYAKLACLVGAKPDVCQDDLAIPTVELPTGQYCDVQVSHAESPEEFYVQLMDQLTELYEMSERMNDTFSKPSARLRPAQLSPGMFLCSQYSADACWYRVKVKSVGKSLATLHYVDYGNTEQVKHSGIYKLPQAFSSLPCQAVACSLNGIVPPNGSLRWPSGAGEGLQSLCVDGCVLIVKGAVDKSGIITEVCANSRKALTVSVTEKLYIHANLAGYFPAFSRVVYSVVSPAVLGHRGAQPLNGCIPVELVDTSSDNDVIIADELVRMRLADDSPKPKISAASQVLAAGRQGVQSRRPASSSLMLGSATSVVATSSNAVLPSSAGDVAHSVGQETQTRRPTSSSQMLGSATTGVSSVASSTAMEYNGARYGDTSASCSTRPPASIHPDTVPPARQAALNKSRQHTSSPQVHQHSMLRDQPGYRRTSHRVRRPKPDHWNLDEKTEFQDNRRLHHSQPKPTPPLQLPLVASQPRIPPENLTHTVEENVDRQILEHKEQRRLSGEHPEQEGNTSSVLSDNSDEILAFAVSIPMRRAFSTYMHKPEVCVTSIDHPTQFYVQVLSSDFDEQLGSMMDGVAKHCQQCEPPEDGYWEAGRVCCAVFSEDETWYRGLITDIGCREAAIFFVDYGNKEVVSFDNMRPLPRKLSVLPQLAVRCHLAKLIPFQEGVASSPESMELTESARPSMMWSAKAIDLFGSLSAHDQVKLTVKNPSVNESLPCDLLYLPVQTVPMSGIPLLSQYLSVSDALINAGLAASFSNGVQYSSNNNANVTPMMPPPAFLNSEIGARRYLPCVVPKEATFYLTVTCVDELGCIYGQYAGAHAGSRMGEEKKMRLSLLKKMTGPEKPEPSPCPSLGEPGCFCSSDQNWYRCHVKQILSASSLEVFRVDDGHTELISSSNFYAEVFRHEVPQLALKFYVDGLEPAPYGYVWPDEVVRTLESFVLDQKVTAQVVCEASDTKPVCLRVTLRSGISVLSRMEARKFRNIPFLSAHDWNRTELTGPIDELSVVATTATNPEKTDLATRSTPLPASYSPEIKSPSPSTLPMPAGFLKAARGALNSAAVAPSGAELPRPVKSFKSYPIVPPSSYPVGSVWPFALAAFVSPNSFIIQPSLPADASTSSGASYQAQLLEKIRQIILALNKPNVAMCLPPLPETCKHMPCAIHLQESGAWHRGLVEEELGDGQVHVRLVDYGHLVEVTREHLRAMPDEFVEASCWMMHARVLGLDKVAKETSVPLEEDGIWPVSASERFMSLTTSGTLSMKILGNTSLYHLDIALFSNGVNVGQQLALEGLARYVVPDNA